MEENTGRKKSGFAAGLLTGIVIMAVISILGFGGWYIVNRNSSGSYTSENVTEGDVSKKLDQLNQLIDKYYLYQDEVDQDALVEGIYSGYAAALGDPYTVYYNKDETKALMESTSGTFSGVGATLTKDADTKAVTIVNVYQDSPAEKAGLKAGDILEKVDDHEVGDEELDTIVSWIKGEKGTEVTLYVLRDGKEETLTATRDTIEAQTVEYEMKDGGIGYIRVSEFDLVTYDQFKAALDDLVETIRAAERAEAAYDRRMYRYKAYYSLDCDNGIENAILLKPQSPETLMEEKQLREQLYAAVMSLPEKQAKRIYARYYLGMCVSEIAAAEGVDPSRVRDSIRRGLKQLAKYF